MYVNIRLKNLKHSHGIEIRSRDVIIIPLMIEENRARFFTFSLRIPLEQGLPQGNKGLIVISLVLTLLINVGFICTVGKFASKNLDRVNYEK